MIENVCILALTVMFIHVCFWEGMIFEKLAQMMHRWPSWVKKPLFDCPICMTIWYGALLIWLELINVPSIGHAIITLFAAGGLNTVLIYLISADKEITKELKEDE